MTPSSAPTPPPGPPPISSLKSLALDHAFSVELTGLRRTLREQSIRITSLEGTEQHNKRLSRELEEARSRIDTLERHNDHLASRRREAVAQFRNMRPLYLESANRFDTLTSYMQAEDLEGMLCIYGSATMTVANAQQRAIATLTQHLREQALMIMQYGQAWNYQGPSGSAMPPPPGSAMPPPPGSAMLPPPESAIPPPPESAIPPPDTTQASAYPPAYMPNGYCRLHRQPYRCWVCGQ